MDLLQIAFGLVVLAFTLTVPGYCLTLAFFPKRNELEELERFAFSFVFSITFLPLLVLIENQVFGIPIDAVSSIASVLLFVVLGVGIWKYRIGNNIVIWKYKLEKIKKGEAVQIWLPKISSKKNK